MNQKAFSEWVLGEILMHVPFLKGREPKGPVGVAGSGVPEPNNRVRLWQNTGSNKLLIRLPGRSDSQSDWHQHFLVEKAGAKPLGQAINVCMNCFSGAKSITCSSETGFAIYAGMDEFQHYRLPGEIIGFNRRSEL